MDLPSHSSEGPEQQLSETVRMAVLALASDDIHKADILLRKACEIMHRSRIWPNSLLAQKIVRQLSDDKDILLK